MSAGAVLSACGTIDRPKPPADTPPFVAAAETENRPSIQPIARQVSLATDTSAVIDNTVPQSPLDLNVAPIAADRALPSAQAMSVRFGGWVGLAFEPEDSAALRARDDDAALLGQSRMAPIPKDTLASRLRSAASQVSDETNHRLDFTHGQVIINISDTVFYRLNRNEIVWRWRF